jgi:hypothetical protein
MDKTQKIGEASEVDYFKGAVLAIVLFCMKTSLFNHSFVFDLLTFSIFMS